ncbi:MAG: hypothetical protein IJ428_02145 [Clostridia bacterium]|nr:hypothetical protein [Clostridia bacterium]
MNTLQNWLIFLAQIAVAVVIIVIIIKSLKYIRAFVKRASLMRRLRAICKEKGFTLKENGVYTSIIKPSINPELSIEMGAKAYLVKFFACLKYKDIYTLTDLSSYTTESTTANIMISFGRPSLSSTTPLHSRDEQRLWNKSIVKTDNRHLKQEVIKDTVAFDDCENVERILCINPVSVDMQVVRTNRPEKIFDGDTFRGCTVYSGNGFCDMLKAQ